MSTIFPDNLTQYLTVLLSAFAVIYLLEIIGMWFVFKKSGIPSWKAIIPFYNTYCIFTLSWNGTFYLWMLTAYIGLFIIDQLLSTFLSVFGYLMPDLLLTLIPSWTLIYGVVSALITAYGFIICLVARYKLGESFSCSAIFNLGLAILPFLFLPVLGFISKSYSGKPSGKKAEKQTVNKKGRLSTGMSLFNQLLEKSVFPHPGYKVDIQLVPSSFETVNQNKEDKNVKETKNEPNKEKETDKEKKVKIKKKPKKERKREKTASKPVQPKTIPASEVSVKKEIQKPLQDKPKENVFSPPPVPGKNAELSPRKPNLPKLPALPKNTK